MTKAKADGKENRELLSPNLLPKKTAKVSPLQPHASNLPVMCFTNMNGPHVEISGVATLCFDEEGTWFQGSITAEDDAQYAIYGTKSLRKRSGTGEEFLDFFLLFLSFSCLWGTGEEFLEDFFIILLLFFIYICICYFIYFIIFYVCIYLLFCLFLVCGFWFTRARHLLVNYLFVIF